MRAERSDRDSISARESPASVPGERKYTLLGMESGILGQCFAVVHPGNYGDFRAELSPHASWQDRGALEKLARHPDWLRECRTAIFSWRPFLSQNRRFSTVAPSGNS
jgi:hypothetical protein